MVFLVLRQRTDSVQALLAVSEGKVSKQMVKWVAGLPEESIVLVQGVIEKTNEEIKSATVGDVEIHINQVSSLSLLLPGDIESALQVHLISSPAVRLPFSIEDASRPESDFENTEKQFKNILLDTRLNNRVLDLRVRALIQRIMQM